MNRLRAGAAVVVLLLAGCSGEDAPGESSPDPTASTPGPTSSPSESDSPSPSSSPSPPPHPVSLPAMMERTYDGSRLRLVQRTAATATYVQHRVRYRGGGLEISGLMNVPRGRGPFPAVVLAHGYIDPDVYDNGQGLRREQDYLGSRGFITLHVDYRNHAFSDKDPRSDIRMRLGYTEDVINAVLALRAWDGPVDDSRIGLLGRSMGGGVVYNVLTVQPGLVDAAVAFAPVSSDTVDNFNRWIRRDPGRSGLAARIIRRYGEPAASPGFWAGVSPRSYFDRITEPVMIHHGTSDDSCPIRWSRRTVAALKTAGADVTYHVYQGEEHAFGPQWPRSMERTVRFLRQHLA